MDRAVEVTHTADGITLLFDTFSGESKNLLESFKNAGAAFHCLHITAAFWCVRLYRDSAGRTGNACCLLRGRHHNIYH